MKHEYTDERPQTSGFYWFMPIGQLQDSPVGISEAVAYVAINSNPNNPSTTGRMIARFPWANGSYLVEELKGQWHGPLVHPRVISVSQA